MNSTILAESKVASLRPLRLCAKYLGKAAMAIKKISRRGAEGAEEKKISRGAEGAEVKKNCKTNEEKSVDSLRLCAKYLFKFSLCAPCASARNILWPARIQSSARNIFLTISK